MNERIVKPQTPAEGILQTGDYTDAKSYHVVCDCGDPDHSHNLWIEADDTGITVSIYAEVKTPWWSMNRWQQIWTLLTRGHLRQETVLTMDEQTALNYAETLKQAIKDVKVQRKKWTDKWDKLKKKKQ